MSAALSSSHKPDPRIAALDALFNPLARSDAPGLVVGVALHGRSLYRRGIGLASVEQGVANTPWTRMRIGSTSKQFTCLAALLLAEEGRLDIDAPVRAYLPELPALPAQGPEPSLRQLMNHSSGYRCYLDLGFIAEGMAIKPAGVAWRVQRRQREANFAPGSQVIYCNSGYQLLSRVIEDVSGLPFEQFLQERIFAPLGMEDTASVPSDFELHPGTATLHLPAAQGTGWRRGIFPTEELRGEGAMVSSIDDMLRWLAHLRAPHKRVGSAASWQQMLAPTRLANGHHTPYGLGLMRHDYRGLEVIHHPGAVIGGASQMLSVPSQALDIIIIGNGAPCSPRELALRIVDALLADQGLAAIAPPAAVERFAPMLGRRYRGRDTGLVFGFARAGDALGLSLLEGLAMPLRDEGVQLCQPFEEGGIGQYLLPTAQLAGAVPPPQLDLVADGRSECCELLPQTPPPLAEAGAPLLGRYRSADLDAEARIDFDGERLLLQIRGAYGGNRFELRALSAEVFGCQALDVPMGHGGNAVLRVAPAGGPPSGSVSGFRLDTPRTRQLAFERCGD
ncbi:serine hydrolase domain-containing protein [Paucibacter sp. M5-1]|uniref:serine hydrolase domain-containing protein n=1 Tax=Paucibacter sp. M5-1 TaxID=3015998 RepID=UPI0022B8DEA8|nr:serine hydrolase domain-containing protein [Paucibacter sp. M5-1]MCZ7879549.1 serine hydrolase [Paucibacter sp. M5-1]